MSQTTKSKLYISASQDTSWWSLFKKMSLGAQVSMIASFILILAGTLGLVFLRSSLLEESQDIRQQAAVADGQIVVTSKLRKLEGADPNAATTLSFDKNILDLYINTKSLKTDAVKLVFEIWPTDNAGEASSISAITQAPDFEVNPKLGLKITQQEIEQNGPGYLIAVTLEPIAPATTFSTQDITQLASVSFLYLSEATASKLTTDGVSSATNLPGVAISFDNNESMVYRYGSNPPKDELQYIARNTFSGPVMTNEETTQLKTTQIGTGGQTIKTVSCNETCASNHQCEAGLACYSGRCRNPLNLESTSCAQANPTTSATMSERCSQACETHRDCPANMLCHAASQSCRLATNPGSLSCSPATNKTVSNLYDSKGAKIDDTTTGSGSKVDFFKPTGSGTGATEEEQSGASTTVSGSVLEQIEAERAKNQVQEQADSQGTEAAATRALGITMLGMFIPIQFILGGLIALGTVICLVIFLTMRGKSSFSRTDFTTSKRILSPEEYAAHEKATQDIKNKIAELRKVEAHTKNEVATHVAQRLTNANEPAMTTPSLAVQPLVTQEKPAQPTQPILPTQPAQPTRAVLPTQPAQPEKKLTPTAARPMAQEAPAQPMAQEAPAQPSSMLNRIKQKNIVTSVFSSKNKPKAGKGSLQESSLASDTDSNQESAAPQSPTQPTNNS
jgi:hypothetical protein